MRSSIWPDSLSIAAVYGLQARGLEGRGLPDWTQRDWVVRCIREIRRIQPHGPYYPGHSFGGLLAWEAAQLLKDDGEEVALLVLIDTLYSNSPALGTHRDGAEGGSGTSRFGKVWQSLRRPVRTVALFAMINVAGFLPMRWTKPEIYLIRRNAPMAISPFAMGWPDRDLPGRVQTRPRRGYNFEPLLSVLGKSTTAPEVTTRCWASLTSSHSPHISSDDSRPLR